MFRITPLRVLKILLFPWLFLIGLWLFLPSPTIRAVNRDWHIQKILTQLQEPITTVHEWHESFAIPSGNGYRGRPNDDCSGLIITWQLIPQDELDSVSLQIGEHLTLNLTHTILQAIETTSKDFKPRLSEPMQVHIPVGDEDHIINMPWFPWSDQVQFHNSMHGFTYDIALRVLVPSPDRVEIWKDLSYWPPNPAVELRDVDREFGMLASFSNFQMVKQTRSNIGRIKVSDVKGKLPSKTYGIRKILLVLLAPMITIGLFILMMAVIPALIFLLPVVTGYAIVVFVVWLYQGRPAFSEWRTTFWMTKWFSRDRRPRDRKARIWGPAGPVYDDEDQSYYGANSTGWNKTSRSAKRSSIGSWKP